MITRLKGAVQNSELTTFGSIKVKVNKKSSALSADENLLVFRSLQPCTVKVTKGNGHIGKTNEDITHTTLEYSTSDSLVYFENEDFEVEISSKYSLTRLKVNGVKNVIWCINVDDLKFNESLILTLNNSNNTGKLSSLANINYLAFFIINSSIKGDIGVFEGKTIYPGNDNAVGIANNPQITGNIASISTDISTRKIYFNDTKVSGDIADFHPSLTLPGIIVLENTEVMGDLEDFAASMAETYESGTLQMYLHGSKVKYNNALCNKKLITFTGSGNYTITDF